jgi:hypothetical protein
LAIGDNMSQFKVSGVVSNVTTKTKSTKFGDKTINYVIVDGQEFSTGFKKLFSAGEMINIIVELKFGEFQLIEGVVPTNQPLFTAAAAAPVAKPAWGGKSGGGGYKSSTFPLLPTDGQMSIVRQNSMNRAVEILKQWQDAGLFVPTSEDQYMKKLIEVAMTVTDFNSGQDIMQMKAAMGQLNVVQV